MQAGVFLLAGAEGRQRRVILVDAKGQSRVAPSTSTLTSLDVAPGPGRSQYASYCHHRGGCADSPPSPSNKSVSLSSLQPPAATNIGRPAKTACARIRPRRSLRAGCEPSRRMQDRGRLAKTTPAGQRSPASYADREPISRVTLPECYASMAQREQETEKPISRCGGSTDVHPMTREHEVHYALTWKRPCFWPHPTRPLAHARSTMSEPQLSRQSAWPMLQSVPAQYLPSQLRRVHYRIRHYETVVFSDRISLPALYEACEYLPCRFRELGRRQTPTSLLLLMRPRFELRLSPSVSGFHRVTRPNNCH